MLSRLQPNDQLVGSEMNAAGYGDDDGDVDDDDDDDHWADEPSLWS